MMRFISFLLFLSVFNTHSFAQNYDVAAYLFHKSIEDAQKDVGKEFFYFNERATELNLKILKFAINKNKKYIDSLQVYKNGDNYYKTTENLFAMYKDITDNEYEALLKIIEDPNLDAKDFKIKKIAIFDSIKKKTAIVFPPFKDAQQQFCKNYNIKIE
ncbi:MAG: hypothetical protein RJA25_439 [Bacteroidota bacterium]|jgi:hypothetical protein